MTKSRVEINRGTTPLGGVSLVSASPHGAVRVVDTKEGTVGWTDKIKEYYKELITFVGMLLAVGNELTPILHWLPINTNAVTVVIGFLTVALTFLKKNEQWVDTL